MLTRRALLAGGAACLACRNGHAPADSPSPPAPAPSPPISPPMPTPPAPAADAMLTRPHPRTGELLPVIGMGTWQTFDVGASEAERAPLRAVLAAFAAAGARVIDSSPMYGASEQVAGDLVAETGHPPRPFWATKVWTRGRAAGEAQIERSFQFFRTDRIDLLQVHNLLDTGVHLATLRRLRDAGRVRYLGVTHYTLASFPDLERAIVNEQLDFVQLPYSVAVRDAEERLLPAAAEHGVAVLVMRPFEGGDLLARFKNQKLPPVAADLGCTSWAQLFLKWILGHPAVHVPLPATANPRHMADNLRAGFGRLPDDAERRTIAALVDA